MSTAPAVEKGNGDAEATAPAAASKKKASGKKPSGKKASAAKSKKAAKKSPKKSGKKSGVRVMLAAQPPTTKGGKGKPRLAISVDTLERADRAIYRIPLNMITSNPGNTGEHREREVIGHLMDQGYRLFPQKGLDASRTLWTMLNGEPGKAVDAQLRQQAVLLIKEFEPALSLMGQNLDETRQVHPIHAVITDSGIGIVSGLVRALARSVRDADQNRSPGFVDGEVDDADGADIRWTAVSENLYRFQSTPIAFAASLKFLKDVKKTSVATLSKNLGMSEQTVNNYLDLTLLPEDQQRAIVDGTMTMTEGREAVQEARELSRKTGRPLEACINEIFNPPTRTPTATSSGGMDDDEGDEGEDGEDGEGGGGGGGGAGPRRKGGRLARHKVRKWDDLFTMYLSQPKPPAHDDLLKKTKEELAAEVVRLYSHARQLMLDVMQINQEDADKLESEKLLADADFGLGK